jgi:hypothetical protein
LPACFFEKTKSLHPVLLLLACVMTVGVGWEKEACCSGSSDDFFLGEGVRWNRDSARDGGERRVGVSEQLHAERRETERDKSQMGVGCAVMLQGEN